MSSHNANRNDSATTITFTQVAEKKYFVV